MPGLNATLDRLGTALVLRAERQRVLASNIANADTPGYAARDFDFASALSNAMGQPAGALAATSSGHLAAGNRDPQAPSADYQARVQPSLDGNSVDMDRERARIADNAIQYESTLRFINSHVRTMLSAIQGQ